MSEKIFKEFSIYNFYNSDVKSCLFAKSWGCIFNFNETILSFIKQFCYPIEKHLINLAYFLYLKIEPAYISQILNLCESMKDFCSKDSILWKMNTNQFNPKSMDINLYNTEIKKEKKLIDYIFNQKIKIEEVIKDEFINCLEKAQIEIDKLLENDEKDQLKAKLLKIKNKLIDFESLDPLKFQLLDYISK